MEKAKRNDWQIKPFPSRYKAVVIEEIYTKAELERITMGLIPQSMDDKWFIFYEEPWLYLHRSWTGLCIFKVCFEVVDEYAAVTEALVNREPGERFGNMDIAEEKFLLEILLDSRAGRYEDAKSKTLNYIQRKNAWQNEKLNY